MFLVTPQQLNRLNHSVPSASNAEIMRHTVENDLDEKMRAILNEDGMNAYEKIKKYNALLQRYLALVKQGEKEERHITLTVAKDSEALKQRVEGGEEEEEEEKERAGGQLLIFKTKKFNFCKSAAQKDWSQSVSHLVKTMINILTYNKQIHK